MIDPITEGKKVLLGLLGSVCQLLGRSGFWGMTETASDATMSFAPPDLPPDAAMAAMSTQGKPVFGAAIRIVGEDGGVAARDGITLGHLQARGHWLAAAISAGRRSRR
jgi:hypothetical protein